MASNPLARLTHEVVARTAKDLRMTDNAVMSRMRKRYAEFVPDFYEHRFQYWTCDALEDVPNALRHMLNRKDGCEVVATGISFYLAAGPNDGHDPMLAHIIDGVEYVFDSWAAHFVPYCKIQFDRSGSIEANCENEPPIDIWLDSLLIYHVQYKSDLLCERLLLRWSRCRSKSASAAFLDFCLRVRYHRSNLLRLYRSPTVLDLVFDRSLIREHCHIAKPLIEAKGSLDYVRGIEQLVS